MTFNKNKFLNFLLVFMSLMGVATAATDRNLRAITNTSGSGIFTFPTTTPTSSRAAQFSSGGALESSSVVDTTELGYLDGVTSALCGISQSCTQTNKTFTSPTLTTPTLGVATATSINKVSITAPGTAATLTLANGSTLATVGANSLTFTTGATTALTLPASGTVATLAGAESFSSKTIVTGIFDDALDLNYETTPSNPAASKVRLYVKSDNKLYKLTSGGTETEIGGTSPSTATDTATGLVTSYAPIVNSAPHAVANASYVGTQTDGYSTHFYSTGNTDRTFTTPAVALSFGREITLVKTDTGTGNVSVALTDGSLIGATNASTLYAQGASTVLRCDGSSWHVVVPAMSTSTIASTFTWNGSGSTSGSITIRFKRIGDWITLFVPDVSPNTGTGSTVLSGNTALPTWARPVANTNRMPLAVTNNGATTTTFGALTVSTGGVLQIVRDPAATAFTNSASAGVAFLATLTYYVGTGS